MCNSSIVAKEIYEVRRPLLCTGWKSKTRSHFEDEFLAFIYTIYCSSGKLIHGWNMHVCFSFTHFYARIIYCKLTLPLKIFLKIIIGCAFSYLLQSLIVLSCLDPSSPTQNGDNKYCLHVCFNHKLISTKSLLERSCDFFLCIDIETRHFGSLEPENLTK